MPQGMKKAGSNRKANKEDEMRKAMALAELEKYSLPDSQHSDPEPAEALPAEEPEAGASRKRSAEDEESPADFSNKMQKMLEGFGVDITKTLAAKKKRLEQHTQSSLKNSNRKVEDIWKNQQIERQKLNDEFRRQMTSVVQQWEADLEKSREQEEKLQTLLRQQQKLLQQTRVFHAQRLKTIRQMQDQYMKSMDELETCHKEQHSNVQSELKKEMALLQKKILMDTQQQEMANVRKSLQTMLF